MFVVVPQMVADTVLAPLVTRGIKEIPPNSLIDMSLCLSISYRFDSTKITIILYTNDQIYFFFSHQFFPSVSPFHIGHIWSSDSRFENLQTGLLINNRLSAPNNPI